MTSPTTQETAPSAERLHRALVALHDFRRASPSEEKPSIAASTAFLVEHINERHPGACEMAHIKFHRDTHPTQVTLSSIRVGDAYISINGVFDVDCIADMTKRLEHGPRDWQFEKISIEDKPYVYLEAELSGGTIPLPYLTELVDHLLHSTQCDPVSHSTEASPRNRM